MIFLQTLLPPNEAWKRITTGLTMVELLYIGITIATGILLYIFVTNHTKKEKYTWRTVISWFIALGGSTTVLFLFAWNRIIVDYPVSVLTFIALVVCSILIVTIFSQKSSDWQKIIHSAFYVVVGFSFLIFFALGATSLTYAISFGLFTGVSGAMMIISMIKMSGKLGKKPEKDDDNPFEDNPGKL
jgi:uncharacterized membrane protein HdeD (DUF308 family)